jgi:putative YphP/YqiW family bacilliredoxin
MYPEYMIASMREELTRAGVEEARTPTAVDAAVTAPGTTLVVVNSVCGCAAGKARPGVIQALQHSRRPDRAITVFAGADLDATDRARAHFSPYPPSSPSVGLMRDGKLVFILERRTIEGQSAPQIAQALTQAFDQFCG